MEEKNIECAFLLGHTCMYIVGVYCIELVGLSVRVSRSSHTCFRLYDDVSGQIRALLKCVRYLYRDMVLHFEYLNKCCGAKYLSLVVYVAMVLNTEVKRGEKR